MLHHRPITIIGGGAGGCFAALRCAERAAAANDMPPVLVDPAEEPGEGLAYGPGTCRSLLLNIPAGRMSLYPEDPDHFVTWVRRRGEALGWAATASAGADHYLPRRLYGAYLRHEVAAAKRTGALRHVRGAAIGLEAETEGGWLVRLGDGRVLSARAVALALGNGVPILPSFEDPDGVAASGFLQRDPWQADRPPPAENEPVLLLGTGLTMVDWALRLGRMAGREAPIYAVSRRGWLPLERGASMPVPPPFGPQDATRGVAWLMRRLREACAASGADWRSVVDGLRPVTPGLWQALSLEDKRRFLRHAQTAWNTHRHRMPAESAAGIRDLIELQRLIILAGRVTRLRRCPDDRVEATVASTGGREKALSVGRVIACTGADTGISRRGSSLVDGMLENGIARPDPMGLGLDATPEGRLIRSDGAAWNDLFGLGPVLRGSLWECTAVPDIRAQAGHLAARFYAPGTKASRVA